jgi:predicted  nucleic acid-binding Zn-ribbon protein
MIHICMKCGGEFDDKGWKGGCPFGCGGSMFIPKHQLGGYEGESFSEWIERRNYEDLKRPKDKDE